MNNLPHRFIQITATACAVFTLSGTAQAVDLRSWDQKIDQASKRFVVLAAFNSEAVLDKETQLVWQRAISAEPTTWASSSHRCLISGAGGRWGWRLPTFSELASLTADGALPAGHPFNGITDQVNLWTATSNQTDGSFAYSVQFRPYNLVLQQYKTTNNHRLCVRGIGSQDGIS